MAASRVSRRGFVGGVATALGAIGLAPRSELWARSRGVVGAIPFPLTGPEEEYDGFAKLANNENPYGPPDSVMKAMTHAMKYSNRYGYPDGGIVEEIAKHHGVPKDNVLIAAGLGEILDVCGTTFLQDGRMLVGADPSYNFF